MRHTSMNLRCVVWSRQSWQMCVQDSQQSVGNGKAYAVCSCSDIESETINKCGFKTEDLKQVALACNEGYTVKVSAMHL